MSRHQQQGGSSCSMGGGEAEHEVVGQHRGKRRAAVTCEETIAKVAGKRSKSGDSGNYEREGGRVHQGQGGRVQTHEARA